VRRSPSEIIRKLSKEKLEGAKKGSPNVKNTAVLIEEEKIEEGAVSIILSSPFLSSHSICLFLLLSSFSYPSLLFPLSIGETFSVSELLQGMHIHDVRPPLPLLLPEQCSAGRLQLLAGSLL
jgi:hypothetical protein